jgi:hypothetical protein
METRTSRDDGHDVLAIGGHPPAPSDITGQTARPASIVSSSSG